MSAELTTFSKFYYGFEVTASNNKLDFNEGSGEITITIDNGSYTGTEIAVEVQSKLNASPGTNTYTCSFNRSTRIFTIASNNAMTLLTNTGTNSATSIYSNLGYSTASDTSSATSHAAGTALGTEYKPQFKLQDYISKENWVEQLHATVNETITGEQELFTYGDKNMMQCRIKFITAISQPANNGVIEDNANAVTQARSFLQWLSKKNSVEFMPDRDTPATYDTYILTRNEKASDGTTAYLREMYDLGLPGYYDSGILTFRKVD